MSLLSRSVVTGKNKENDNSRHVTASPDEFLTGVAFARNQPYENLNAKPFKNFEHQYQGQNF